MLLSKKILQFIWIIFCVPAICTEKMTSVFLEQPGPGPVVAPNGTQLQLNCSVMEEYIISWHIFRPGSTVPLISGDPGVSEALRDQGITVTSSSTVMSLLTMTATEMNNQTEVECAATDGNDVFSVYNSQRVRVTTYGPPSTPINFMATENGVGSLRISWSSSFSIEGVTVEFTLTATDLNTSNTTIVKGIQEQHYIFTVEDSSSCDVYTFQVTVLNAAGSSGPSEILTRSLPSLPDASSVEDSLEQNLVKTADGVTLSVMFQGIITSCPEYPVTSYTLVLVDSEGNETRESSAVTSGEITLVVDGLMEDSLYSYYIVATNMIGNNSSTHMLNLSTTDVWGVSICLVENITYSIQCSYITGSDARGCVYTLVSGVEGVANITGTVTRNSSEGVQIDIIPNVDDFVELLVFHWKRDNNTGTAPLRQNWTLNNVVKCVINTSDMTSIFTTFTNLERESSGKSSIILTAVASSLLAAIILCIIFITTITIITCSRRHCKKKLETSAHVLTTNSPHSRVTELSLPVMNTITGGDTGPDANVYEDMSDNRTERVGEDCSTYDEIGTFEVPRVTSLTDTHLTLPYHNTLQDFYSHLNHKVNKASAYSPSSLTPHLNTNIEGNQENANPTYAQVDKSMKKSKSAQNKEHLSNLTQLATTVDTTGAPEVPKRSAKFVKDAEYAVLDTTGAPEVPKRSAKSVKDAEYAVVGTTGAPEVPKRSTKSVKDAEYAVVGTTGAPEVPKRSAKSIKDAEYAVVGTTGAPEVPKRCKTLEEYVKEEFNIAN